MNSEISGTVATFRYVFSDREKDFEFSEVFFKERMDGQLSEYKYEMEDAIKRELGNTFYIERLEVKRGSVEILVVIGTAYYVVAKYKNFNDSLSLAKTQVERILRRFFNRPIHSKMVDLDVKSEVIKSGSLLQSQKVSENTGLNFNIYRSIVFYLILSNLIMLGVIIYLVLTGGQ